MQEPTVDNDIESNPTVQRQRILSVTVMGFSSLGAIYGDIGTSPLYVLNTIFSDSSVSEKDALGATSCIFWLFTLIVIVKYCLLVLSLGPNNGEGGQVAIYCKLSRVLNTGPLGVRLPGQRQHDDLQLLTRSETRDSAISSGSFIRESRSLLSNTKFKRFFSFTSMCACFFGCALVIGDGLLTPTTSVLSAVDGIAVAVPSFSNKVMPVAICILLGLFLVQPMGSQLISISFSPIIIVWFITILVIGIINIVHHPEVFKALSPKQAIDFLKSKGDIDVLGSVMLSVTGCEAMFADVGHFSPLSVQLTLGVFVYPCLMIQYLGQASYLIDHPDKVSNIFFNSIPGGTSSGFYWFVFVLSTLATIIASQALILGCFSILNQMIQIDCFPRLKVIHKSAKHRGQIFIPTVNFLLMIAVVCTCIGFKSSSKVTAAYGLGVSMDLFITSILLAATIPIVYKVHWAVALLFFFPFGTLEMCLIIANMKKVPHGAWFSLMIAVTMFLFISTWRWGVCAKVSKDRKGNVRLKDVLSSSAKFDPSFVPGDRGTQELRPSDDLVIILNEVIYSKVPRHNGIVFMHADVSLLLSSPNIVPGLFKDLMTNFPSLPEIFVFLAIKVASVPYVEDEERVLVQSMGNIDGIYRCIIRYGFMDKLTINDKVIKSVVSELRSFDSRYFEKMGPSEHTFPLHILSRENICGRKRYSKFTFRRDSFPSAIASFTVEAVRSFIIERFFSPLYNLQAIPSSLISCDDCDHERIIYIGKDIEL